MRVRLPHELDKAEVRRRLEAGKGEIAGYFPDGMASMDSTWAGDDRMDFRVSIAGQRVNGNVEIEDDQVVISVNLPLLLTFLEGTVERSVRKEGTRLLA